MLLIARRYLLSAKSHSVVNIIAWVSLVSLLLPVAAVVVLLSIFNGFGAMVGSVEESVEGDLTIRVREGRRFDISEIDRAAVESIEGVEALSFQSEQMALLSNDGVNSLVTLRGVDEGYQDVVALGDRVYAGEFESDGKINIGLSMAVKLGVRSLLRDSIDVISLNTSRLQSLLGVGRMSSSRLPIASIVALDADYEEQYGYTSIEEVNSLAGVEGVATRLSLRVDPEANIERTREAVEAVVGDRFKVELRSELNPTMYHIIRYEKMGVLLISSFVMLLASFSLIGALTMLIIEKSGDVETLRAMGMTRRAIRQIFFVEGVLISSVAIVGGVVLGSLTTLVQQHWGVIVLPSSSMEALAYPVELQCGDIVEVVAIALAMTLAISWGVSRRVVKMK